MTILGSSAAVQGVAAATSKVRMKQVIAMNDLVMLFAFALLLGRGFGGHVQFPFFDGCFHLLCAFGILVGDDVGGIALLFFNLRTIVPISVFVVIACACEETHEFVKAVIGGIVSQVSAAMPFAEQGRFVAGVFQ